MSKYLKKPTGEYKISSKANQDIVLSLVIPTLLEGENIAILLERLVILLDTRIKDKYEIIVVDDNSFDKTWQIAFEFAKKYPQIKVLRRVDEKGLATAVIRGWQCAKGKYLAVMDGDLQHPLEPLLKMLSEMEKGADLVLGSRHIEGGGLQGLNFSKKIISNGAKIIGYAFLPKVVSRVSDPMSGYFMVSRKAIADVKLNPLGYKIMLEVIARGRIENVKEVGYYFGKRVKGKSKRRQKQSIEYIIHLLILQIASWPIFRFAKWFGVASIGFVVDITVFHLFLTYTSVPLVIATLLSAEAAIINNFFWHERWTFGDIAKKIPSLYQKGMRFWKFNLICLSGLLLHVFILRWLVVDFGFNPYIAKVITILLVGIWNITLNFRFSWQIDDNKK